MCAALTVPIIKDGYRLYPGMPVNGGVDGRNGAGRSLQKSPKSRQSNYLPIHQDQRLSSPDSIGSPSASGSPPRLGNRLLSPVVVQPRVRTSSNPSQISARSSFDVGPTTIRPDLIRGRSAISTSQLYMQQRRELAIQQQRKQDLARRQAQQQQQRQSRNRKSSSPASIHQAQLADSNGNVSAVTDYDAEDSLNFCDSMDHRRTRKLSSPGDHNNNKETNPLRKFLKRLGIGTSNNTSINHRSTTNSCSEDSIEQAVPALQCLHKPEVGVAISARQ